MKVLAERTEAVLRYYVVCKSEVDGIAPHIIAEFVRHGAESDDYVTLASVLAGERRVIVTREELLDHPIGPKALNAWQSEDDSAYDEECAAVRPRDRTPRRGLRLVKTGRGD